MDKYIGRRLEGRYEILELIGVGGMANVYKGRDTIENRTVAIKLLREEYLENEEFLRRFKTESKAMTVLSHPNIVKVYDVSFSDKINSIVMELIEGITLKEYIERQGVLSWKETLYFTIQILRALQHAHDKGIVHRDIKPHNVMLLPDGTIKVTDFGIARFARSEVKTLTDRAIGSVHYISPEQARGSHTDARTDIYSVGVMLFEMLTGKLPFEADSPVSVALKQIQTQPIMPRSLNPDIPAGLEDITMRAMRKDIAGRYQSAAEMLRCLDAFKRDPSLRFDSGKGGNRGGADDGDGEPRSRGTPVVAILTGITFAFVLASAAFIFFMVQMNNPFEVVQDVVVPTLTELKYDSVKKSSRYASFDIRIEANDFNDEYPKGVIYEQEPKPGRKVKAGSVIKVKVSSGPRQVLISEYSGQDAMSVHANLSGLGLEVSEVSEFSSTVPEGSVIRTDPPRNSSVASGSKITLYVSLGPENKYVDVPDILGFNIEDARVILQGYKLKIGTITPDPDSDMPGGTILSQDPPSTSKLEQGSGVNVVVSEGDMVVPRLMAQVLLPLDIEEVVELQAVLDGNVVHTDSKVPSEVRVWRITLEGQGQSKLSVFIDSKLYQEFDVDFDSNTYVMTTDNSDSF